MIFPSKTVTIKVYVVVVGAGEVGVYITRLLTDPKHQLKNMEVAVIDMGRPVR